MTVERSPPSRWCNWPARRLPKRESLTSSRMTKMDKRKEVQPSRTELKAHDLDLDSLDSGIAKLALAACSHGELAGTDDCQQC